MKFDPSFTVSKMLWKPLGRHRGPPAGLRVNPPPPPSVPSPPPLRWWGMMTHIMKSLSLSLEWYHHVRQHTLVTTLSCIMVASLETPRGSDILDVGASMDFETISTSLGPQDMIKRLSPERGKLIYAHEVSAKPRKVHISYSFGATGTSEIKPKIIKNVKS